ncbi:MAG: LysR family transcriptional regulator [Clostridiales Family XIII bacterium]|jgi:DNA-binding transcriptional LysR family regulator|nr:LysR family transcriptional regulator [Clostridiales Family XIII bacterium]
MEIRQLQYFVMIAEEKSFLQASKRVFISQQALSKTIQNLEHELGVPLFERSNAGVELTPFGTALLHQATRILALVDATLTDLGEMTGGNKQGIRFGVTNGIMDIVTIDALFNFQACHPEWNLTFTEGDDRKIEHEVYRERLDMGLISGVGDETIMHYHLVSKDPTFIGIHEGHPLASRETLTLTDLKGESFIIGSDDYFPHNMLVRACEEVGFLPKIGYVTTNANLIARLLTMDKAVFTCPQSFLGHIHADGVRFIPLADDPYIFRMYLIRKKGLALSRPSAAFWEFMRDTLIAPKSA